MQPPCLHHSLWLQWAVNECRQLNWLPLLLATCLPCPAWLLQLLVTVEQHLGVGGGAVSVVKAWRRSQVCVIAPLLWPMPCESAVWFGRFAACSIAGGGVWLTAPYPPSPPAFCSASCLQLQSYGRSYTLAPGERNPLRCVVCMP